MLMFSLQEHLAKLCNTTSSLFPLLEHTMTPSNVTENMRTYMTQLATGNVDRVLVRILTIRGLSGRHPGLEDAQ